MAVVLFLFIIANPRRICKRRFFLAIPARMRLGPRPKRLLRRSLRKSSAEALRREAAAGSANPRFYSLFWRANCGRRPRQRDRRGGIPKGAQPSLASLCLLSAGQKVGAPARPERVEGKIINLKKGKGITKVLGKIKKAYPAAQTG